MSDTFLTLADLTAMQFGDTAVGIVEIVRQVSPELSVISGRPIPGTHARITRRKELPGGTTNIGGTLFRGVGEGVEAEASKLEQIVSEAYYLDGQLEVDEALVKAQPTEKPEDILAMEASGQIRAKTIGLGVQFYKGTSRDAKGFIGLIDLCDSSMVIKGSGAGAGVNESVWLVRNSPDGVHFVFGNGKGLQAGQWMRQRVTKSNKHYFAYVNNFSGYIGLGMNHPFSIVRIANLDDSGTAGHYITDQVLAQAHALFPVGFGPTHCFMSRRQRRWLRASRSVVSAGNLTASTPLVYAPIPNETSEGVPIHVTDSITLTEAVVS